MPQIEIPFTVGQRVRTRGGNEFEITALKFENGSWRVSPHPQQGWWLASELTLVEPVIKWERNEAETAWDGYVEGQPPWWAYDRGVLYRSGVLIGTFPDPRAVAEETQALWNERAASNEREGK